MSVIVVCTLCFINLLLWFLFFKKFKKLFSTDNLIETTRNELNRMILDVNRNAERNITLIEARISELKTIIAQADSHVTFLKSEIEKTKLESAYKAKLETVVHSNPAVQNYKVDAYRKNASRPKVTPDSAYEVAKPLPEEPQQSLFENENKSTIINSEVKIAGDGSAFREVPVLGETVHMADNPIVMKKSFNDEVNERYLRGETVEEIAASLARSVTEVQFVLDMNE